MYLNSTLRSDGKILVNEQDIMTDIQTFNENLYSSNIDQRRVWEKSPDDDGYTAEFCFSLSGFGK